MTDAGAPLGPGVIGRLGSYRGAHARIRRIEVSADGGRLVTWGDQLLRVWDARARRMLVERVLGDEHELLAFPARGDRVLFTRRLDHALQQIVSLELSGLTTAALLTLDAGVPLAVSPDGEHLAYRPQDALAVETVPLRRDGPRESVPVWNVSALALASGARTLWAGGSGRIERWDRAMFRETARWQVPGAVHALAVSDDGRLLAAVCGTELLVMDAASGETRFRMAAPLGPRFAFARGGHTVLLTGHETEGALRWLWVIDPASREPRVVRRRQISWAAGTGDAIHLATDSRFGPLAEFPEAFGPPDRVVWLSRDGARALISRPPQPTVEVWERATGARRRMDMPADSPGLIAMSPDTAAVHAALPGRPGFARGVPVSLDTGARGPEWEVPHPAGAALARLTPLDAPGRVLWGPPAAPLTLLQPGRPPARIDPGGPATWHLFAGHPRQHEVVVREVDRASRFVLFKDPSAIKIAALHDGAEGRLVAGAGKAVFLENPVRILFGSVPRAVDVADTHARKLLRLAPVAGEPLWQLAASPDGSLAAGAFPGAIAVWDARTGRLRARIPISVGYVEKLAVDAAERIVTICDADKVLTLFELPEAAP